MDPQSPAPHSLEPDSQPQPPRQRVSRRATRLGSLIAVVVVLAVGFLAWELTHREAPAASGAGAPGGAPASGRAGARGPGGGGPGGGAGRGPATTVGVAVAEHADIPIVIEALGTVVPQATVRVRPQVSGVLQQLSFKEGQMVRKGDLLALIDPRQFEMTLQQAIGQRMRDEAQLEAARVTLERYRTLLQQDSIARQDVDTQAALVKQLEGTVVADKANEGTARLNLGYTRVVAPIGGRVGLRTVDVGNVVSPSDANGVAVITQLSPIDVEFAVPQDQAPELQRNAAAAMEAKALDRTRTDVLDVGVFASLDNQVDTQTGTTTASRMVRTLSCTLTNWLGNSAWRVLLKRALARTVPVWVSTWLSSDANTPVSSTLVRVRSSAFASMNAPALRCRSGAWSCGTAKTTSIGDSCVMRATPLVSLVLTTLPTSTVRRPTRPATGATTRV
jgi:multidrug efflux system membrane fusion protein